MTFTNNADDVVTIKPILKLIPNDAEVLHQPAEPIDLTKLTDLSDTIDNMWNLMTDSGGVGLAAPQVGLNIQLFLMNVDLIRVVVINPVIISVSGKYISGFEGCLSYPGLALNVTRPELVDVAWYDESGKPYRTTLTGFEARVWLHEYDHLMGICFVDRVSDLSIAMAKKKAKKRIARRSTQRVK